MDEEEPPTEIKFWVFDVVVFAQMINIELAFRFLSPDLFLYPLQLHVVMHLKTGHLFR